MKNTLLLISLCALVLAVAIGTAHADTLKAGAAMRIVTPDPLLPISGGISEPDPAEKKIGELSVRAMVLEKDGVRIAIVGMDFLGWPAVLGNKIRAQVQGIPAENILIGVTHTHSAPDTYAFTNEKGEFAADLNYLEGVCKQTADAINEAVVKLQPAVLKINTDEAKGKIAYNYYAPELYDPRCSVLQAIATEGPNKGKPIVTMVNYAIHPEVIGSHQAIVSPDLCGPLYDRIETVAGGMALFMNGAQGGMVTADCRGPKEDIQTWEECIRIGELLANEALRIVDAAPVQENPTLYCTAKTLSFPLESPLLQAVLQASPLGYKLNPDKTVSTQLNLINVGTAQILNIPGEALPNIGYYVKRHMPTPHAFLLGLTNDAFGYMLAKVDWNSFKRYDYISETGLGEMTGEIYMDQALALVNASPKPDPIK